MTTVAVVDEWLQWPLTQRTSLQWPKHWQAVIYKIDRVHNTTRWGNTLLLVYPRNPEYQAYLDKGYLSATDVAPRPYLDSIEFETLDKMDAWARVAARLSK